MANGEDKKDYFHIGKMTEEFRKKNGTVEDDTNYRVWDLRFKLAIAQQLSVISARLGEIVGKAKE